MINPSLALVTGATSGIGKALCPLLIKEGFSLLVTGRNEKELQTLEQDFPGKIIKALPADLSNEDGRQTVIALIHEYAPTLIINNAGFGLYGEALSYSTEEQKQVVEVNVLAVVELTLEAARALVSTQKKGVILNVSSAAAFQVAPNLSVYASSKAFVNTFSQSLDEEFRPYGIRVLATCPGMVKTSFSERAGGQVRSKMQQEGVMNPEFIAEEIWRQIQSKQPLRIVDWKYRVLTYLSYLLPKKWVATMFKQTIAERIAPRPIIKIPSCTKKSH